MKRKHLTPQETRLLGFLYKYRHKELNMKAYAILMGKSRRWTRTLASNLREKGYIQRLDEGLRPGNYCTFKFVIIDESGNVVE